jgi:putative peptidoglycan lipid II flippase
MEPKAPHRPRRSGLLRSALGMSSITLLSRVLGLVREALRANYLGTGAASDAFGVAFQLPNLLRRFMGEGAMSAGFVPVFARKQQEEHTAATWRLASRSANLLFLVAGGTVILGILGAPVIVDLYVWLGAIGRPDAGVEAATRELTISLTRWMFPYLLFVSLAALVQGVLNTFRIFWVSAFSAVLLNVVIIAAALWLAGGRDPRAASYVFAGAVVVGGVAQLAFQLPWLRGTGYRWSPAIGLRDPAIRDMARLLVPATLGAGIYQLNVMVSQAIAYTLPEGSVSSLQYSSRLLELTLGVFAVSVATVILPRLSKEAGHGDLEAVRGTLAYAIRMVVFICLPATVGLSLLRRPIVSVLFERGEFGSESLAMTVFALSFHAPGLLFIALHRVLVPVFYALKDTKRPMIAAGASMVLNIGLCYALREPLGHGGIALANSASALLSAVILALWLGPRVGGVAFGQWAASALRSLAASAALGAALWWGSPKILSAGDTGLAAAPGLFAAVLLGALLYLTTAHLLGASEPRELLAVLRRRRSA